MSIFDYYLHITGKNESDYVKLHKGADYSIDEDDNEDFTSTPQFSSVNRDMLFKDFTFICTDGEVKAHRCILWNRCEMFKTKVWNISDVIEIEVDFKTDIVNKVIDYIYGKSLNLYDPIDFDSYKFLDMINPSVNNAYMLVKADPDEFNKILDYYKDFEAAGVNPNRIIAIMASYILNTESIKNFSTNLPVEVVEDILDSDYLYSAESMVMQYVNRYIRDNESISDEDVKALFSKVRWVYLRHSYVSGKWKKYVPSLTIEQIREGYLNPHHRIKYDVGRAKYVDRMIIHNERAGVYKYDKDTMTVVDKTYKVSDIFSKEEYKLFTEE